MKLETVRMLVAALADGTNGINAKIAALTLDGADARPATPTVYNDVDHRWVARRRVDDADLATITFPALAVFQLGRMTAVLPEPYLPLRDADVQIGFAHIGKGQDSALALRDALYANHALMRWFSWFLSQDPNGATRTRNGVTVADCTGFVQDDVHEEFDGVDCLAQSVAGLVLRDSSP